MNSDRKYNLLSQIGFIEKADSIDPRSAYFPVQSELDICYLQKSIVSPKALKGLII